MDKCSFSPYEGNKPYIFVSYAHKDSDRVYPVLNELAARGYRIWYDDGITPGSEWPENIAQHLNNCTVTMAFISPNSLNSDYCRREITFALSKKKTFLTVMLEDIELPLGLELQLSAQQCVMGYLFPNVNELVQKICLCPDLKPCLEPPVAPVAPPAEPVAPPVEPVVQTPPSTPRPAPQPSPEHKPYPPQPPVSNPQPGQFPPVSKPASSSQKKPMGMWIGIAAAVLVLVIIVATVAGGGKSSSNNDYDPNIISKVTIVSDVTVKSDIEELLLTDETIDQTVFDQLNKLTKLTTLTFENCNFLVSTDVSLSTLTTLRYDNCTGPHYLLGLDKVPNLQTLSINKGQLYDGNIPEFTLPGLKSIWITNNPNISDLSKLKGCTSLELVGVDGTSVSDLTPLLDLPNLCAISADSCPITSIDYLAAKTNLEELSFNNCQIQNITTKMPQSLTHLYFNSNPLQNISGLDHLSNLVLLDIGNTYVTNFTCIKNSADTLRYADVTGCEMDVADALKECENMEELTIDNVFLFDADCFSKMTNLRYLSANSCNLYSAHDLVSCIHLEELHLLNNAIDDLDFLTYFLGREGLILDLSINTIKNGSKLPERIYYEGLSLFNNPVDFSTIGQLEGNELILSYNETLNVANLPNGLNFKSVTIIDCPKEMQSSLRQIFPNDVEFLTMDEFLS